jgi:hypothetical protein
MKINKLSIFAAGILLATSICGVVYFSGDPVVSKAAGTKTQTSETEMKNKLLKAGYVVQTKEEYDKNLEAAKNVIPPEQKEPEKVMTQAVITVEDGMTSIDVGRMLVDAKIVVTDAFQFSQDIEQKGLQNNLRPGAFDVNTDMTYDQIIATIFK